MRNSYKKNKKPLRIVSAKIVDTHSLEITFTDGTISTINIANWILRRNADIYMKYLNPEKFAKFTVTPYDISWEGNELDFYYESLYPNYIKDRIYKYAFG